MTITGISFLFTALSIAYSLALRSIGNKIGERDIKGVHIYSRKFLILAFILGNFGGSILLIIAPYVPLLFNVSDDVRRSATLVIYILSVFTVVKSLNIHFVIGMFRGGGDTKFSFMIDIIGTWFVGVPLAVIFGLILKFPLHLVVFIIITEEALKAVLGFFRYRSNRWIHDVAE